MCVAGGNLSTTNRLITQPLKIHLPSGRDGLSAPKLPGRRIKAAAQPSPVLGVLFVLAKRAVLRCPLRCDALTAR
jgi:hypothetical protein